MNRRPIRSLLAISLPALIAVSAASAQSRQIPAAKQNHPIVITNATIHTLTDRGTIERGYVYFENGVITSVGPTGTLFLDDARKAQLKRYDGTGLHVYPGLISSETNLGLTEIGAVDVTQDHTEYGSVKPEVRAAVAVNPDSDLIPVARANGILTAMTFPGGGLVSGRCSLIRLDGWTWEEMAIDPAAGLVVSWPRTEPISSRWMRRSEEEQRKQIAEDLENVERVFDEVVAYLDARANDPALETDLRYEAMAPFVRGEKPVFVRASAPGQIESAVAWADRRGLRIVIVGGTQADRVAKLLVEHDVPVIIDGVHRMPSNRDEAYDEAFTLPKRLHEAGVRFAIASGAGAAHERNLNHNVATAAAYGLPKEEALKAVTVYAAEILGAGDRLGSLEAGKAATLIITTGDPLEITNDVLLAFIDGRQLDLGSKHKAMYAKYREKYEQLGLVEGE